jgi:hypothetical protein
VGFVQSIGRGRLFVPVQNFSPEDYAKAGAGGDLHLECEGDRILQRDWDQITFSISSAEWHKSRTEVRKSFDFQESRVSLRGSPKCDLAI